jgi:hypothetical protein
MNIHALHTDTRWLQARIHPFRVAQVQLSQARNDIDIGTYTLDVHPTVPTVCFQTRAHKHSIGLGKSARDIVVCRMATQDHRQMGRDLFDVPHQTSIGRFIGMRHLNRLRTNPRGHMGDVSRGHVP